MTLTVDTGLDFTVPDGLNAIEPAEARGLARDGVRMLVGTRPGRDGSAPPTLSHHTVADLPEVLRPGDLVVVNNSGTLPAALRGTLPDGAPVVVHVSSARPDERGAHLIELRRPVGGASAPYGFAAAPGSAGSDAIGHAAAPAPASPARPGLVIALPGGARAELTVPFTARLWFARLVLARAGFAGDGSDVLDYLLRHGTPIRYSYLNRDWPLSDYQTVFATEPGSSEMPSAARPFTADLVARLVSRGVTLAPITLHTGVASPEAHETPYAEWFRVPAATADLVEHTRAHGGRVIAIGTTVVRALESAVRPDGRPGPAEGWTELIIRPAADAQAAAAGLGGVRVVDGLLTGWHEPRASHLMMLEAIAGRRLLDACYAEALREGYLWHEFGDVNLLLNA